MSTSVTALNQAPQISSTANNSSAEGVKIRVGNDTKTEQLENAVKNNKSGLTVIIPGNLSSSTIQNLLAFFKKNVDSFRVTLLDVAADKLTLSLKAADDTKQATMIQAGFQMAGAAVSGLWVGGALRQHGMVPNKIDGGKIPDTAKLPDDKLDGAFSQALDNRPPAPVTTRNRDLGGAADDMEFLASGKGVNLQAHIQMSQAAQGVLGGVGGLAAAPLQHGAEIGRSHVDFLGQTGANLQELISYFNNATNSLS